MGPWRQWPGSGYPPHSLFSQRPPRRRSSTARNPRPVQLVRLGNLVHIYSSPRYEPLWPAFAISKSSQSAGSSASSLPERLRGVCPTLFWRSMSAQRLILTRFTPPPASSILFDEANAAVRVVCMCIVYIQLTESLNNCDDSRKRMNGGVDENLLVLLFLFIKCNGDCTNFV